MFQLKEAIKAKSELPFPADTLKLYVKKLDEGERDLDGLDDGNEVFDFTALCIKYKIKKSNPISVVLPRK